MKAHRRSSGGGSDQDAVSVAAKAAEGPGMALPHLQQIQESFGHHDLSGAVAHIDVEHTASLGADAFAYGAHAVFSGNPTLWQAAHEAAHLVVQGAGKGPGAQGARGDSWEKHADTVADLVVAGESAEATLDQLTGGPASVGAGVSALQFDRDQWQPEKEVSGKAGARLKKAQEAIDFVKSVLEFGAGNQKEALEASNFNSYFRMQAMRDWDCWELDPQLYELARMYPNALTAAMGGLAKGGNCGEHAQIAYDWLRMNASSEVVTQGDVEGLDHAFIFIGDLDNDSDQDLTISDPWPSAPQAVLWEDHFAFTRDREKINRRRSVQGDDRDVASILAGGLKLSAKGQQMIEWQLSEEKTKEEIDKGTEGDHPWIWQHPNAAARGRRYNYKVEE